MPTCGSSPRATCSCARMTGPTRCWSGCARRSARSARGCRRSGATASVRATSRSVVAGAGVTGARPRGEYEQQAGVGRGAHLVALARVEDREQPGAAGDVADRHLTVDHEHVRALVDLVLREPLARHQLQRDRARLAALGGQDLRLARLDFEAHEVPVLHGPGPYRFLG